jgi:hypothetical protein
MERCPNCQQEIAPGLDACKFCHTALYKPCPLCKEKIRAQAIKCRFCQADLNAPASPPASTRPPEMNKLESDAQLAMILGIVAIVGFWITAPFAWWIGSKVNRRLEELGQPKNSNATLGYVLGMIVTILGIIGFVIGMGIFIIAILAAVAGAAS